VPGGSALLTATVINASTTPAPFGPCQSTTEGRYPHARSLAQNRNIPPELRIFTAITRGNAPISSQLPREAQRPQGASTLLLPAGRLTGPAGRETGPRASPVGALARREWLHRLRSAPLRGLIGVQSETGFIVPFPAFGGEGGKWSHALRFVLRVCPWQGSPGSVLRGWARLVRGCWDSTHGSATLSSAVLLMVIGRAPGMETGGSSLSGATMPRCRGRNHAPRSPSSSAIGSCAVPAAKGSGAKSPRWKATRSRSPSP
jgi:hypothetical protein